MKLPYGDRVSPAQIIQKLETYALNSSHSSGKHKARLFRAKLGITLENKELLVNALLQAASVTGAAMTISDQYGDRYVIDFLLKTEVGASLVRSAWIIRRGEAYPRLTSVYPIQG
ncbi:DUF6883 domain-containing protein [Almyronema epifaneia]|uniref:DUF6883 domain-containing protein n=1 Tax=Almyronema epifaneia S1 TaxID=2991925 RepID=A0ABW6IJN1_9CYAN